MSDINTDELVKALHAATIAFDAHTRAQETAINSQRTAADASDAFAQAQAQAATETDANSKKTSDALKSLAQSMGSSAIEFGKAMYTGGEGTAKYSGAVTGAADAAGNFAATMLSAFGPLGMVVGTVVKVFGALVGASLKQNDQLMKSYRELSEIGSISGSLEQLDSDLHKVGLTAAEAEKFGAMLQKVAPDLANFGGSVSTGKDKLLGVIQGMIGPDNQIERAMGRIGYSADAMKDATADYIAKQTRLGLAQGKTEGQLRDESVKYMITLRELGELTGMSRDEAQKIMDQQQADARWALTLRRMTIEGRSEEATALADYMTTYQKTFGADSARGLMEQIANNGAMVGEASIKTNIATQNKAYEAAIKVSKGQASVQAGLAETAGGVMRNVDQFGKAIDIAGKGMENVVGDNQLILGAVAVQNKSNIDVNKKVAAQQLVGSGLLESNMSIEQKARQARIIADNLLLDIGGKTVGMFESLVDIMHKFAKFLAQTVDKLSFGKTNFAAQFKDKEDFQADLKAAQEDKVRATEKALWLEKQIKEISADATVGALNAKIKQLEAKEKESGAPVKKLLNNGSTEDTIKDPVAHALAVEQLAVLKTLKDNSVARGGLNLDKLNTIKEAEVLKLREKTAKSEAAIIAAQKGLGSMTADRSSSGAAAGATRKLTEGTSTAGGGRGGQGGATSAEAGSPEKLIEFTGNSGSRSHFDALEEETKKRLLAAAETYSAATGGKKLQLNSANRSYEEQQRLWDESVALGTPGIGPTNMKVAKPGTSRHESGRAVDIQNYYDEEALKALKAQGFTRPVSGDDVHFELPQARDGGAFSGPTSGYPVALHGKNESVWPEDKLKAVLAEVQKSSIEDYKKEILADMGLNKSSPAPAPAASPVNSDGIAQMMEMMTTKFDSMIAQLDSSNSTLRDLLTYTRA